MELQIRTGRLLLLSKGYAFTQMESSRLQEMKGIVHSVTAREAELSKPWGPSMQCVHDLLRVPKLPPSLLTLAAVDPRTNPQRLDVPAAFHGELREHQRRAFDFAASRRNSVLALEMGLGKTPISTAVLLRERVRRALVVAPASLRVNWSLELARFAPGLRPIDVKTGKQARKVLAADHEAKHDVFVVSYSLLDKLQEEMARAPFDVVIADEAHLCKNDSKRAAAFRKVAKAATRKVVLLTGTPGERHAALYNLMRCVAPDTVGRFHHFDVRRHAQPPSSTTLFFAERYCLPELQRIIGGRMVYNFKKSQRVDELRALLAPHMLSMKKTDVLDLPPLQREYVAVTSLGPRVKAEYEKEMERISKLREDKGTLLADAALMELLRRTMRLKAPDVCAYLRTMLSTYEGKMIVFFHHMELKDKILETLTSDGTDHIVVDGSTPMKARQALFDRFRDDAGCRVAVLSLQACSTGLNFQFASLVIFAELVWSSILHAQAEARCHRIGQVNSVLCQYLAIKGTTDDLVWQSINSKISVQAALMETETSRKRALPPSSQQPSKRPKHAEEEEDIEPVSE